MDHLWTVTTLYSVSEPDEEVTVHLRTITNTIIIVWKSKFLWEIKFLRGILNFFTKFRGQVKFMKKVNLRISSVFLLRRDRLEEISY